MSMELPQAERHTSQTERASEPKKNENLMDIAEQAEMTYFRLCRWIINLIFRKVGTAKLKKLIWGSKQPLRLSHHFLFSQGTIYVHPLILLRYGLLSTQVVQIFISFRTRQGILKHEERLLRVATHPAVPINNFMLGSDDIFNIFGKELFHYAELECIRPYSSIPISLRVLSNCDAIRLAPVKHISRKTSDNYTEELTEFFRTPRIVYKHDVISIVTSDFFTGKKTPHCFRIDCSESPRVVSSATAVYETASVNMNIPFGGYTDFDRKQPSHLPILPNTITKVVDRARDLINASETIREEPLVLLLIGGAGSGKRLLVERIAQVTHQCLLEVNCYDIWSEIPAQTEAKLKAFFDRARSYQPCLIHLSSIDVLGFDPNSSEIDHRIISTLKSILDEPARLTVVFSCRTDQVSMLSQAIESLALYHFSIDHLNEEDRFNYLGPHFNLSDTQHAVKNSSGFSIAEMNNLLADVRYRMATIKVNTQDALQWAIDKRNASFADAIGAPKIPSVNWDDVGGLEETKQLVTESIEGHLRGGKSLKRSGIILFGPPGCGKTLIAKAVATEYKIAFLSVKGPELLNKYIGQSEENLRKVFERARQASPCVIFFDELDSLAPNRGRSGDSGGVMDRIVSQLLSELDTLHNDSQSKVFVMAATNRADLLDPSLLTPGRFDKVVNVSPSKSVDSKVQILNAISRKVKKANDVDIAEIAKNCSEAMSGAELYSLVSSATMLALREQISSIESGKLKLGDAKVLVSQKHFTNALNEVNIRKTIQQKEN